MNTVEPGCLACRNNGRLDSLPPRERVAEDAPWRVAHAFDSALPGWLVLRPTRAAVFGYLHPPPDQRLGDDRMDALATTLRARLGHAAL